VTALVRGSFCFGSSVVARAPCIYVYTTATTHICIPNAKVMEQNKRKHGFSSRSQNCSIPREKIVRHFQLVLR